MTGTGRALELGRVRRFFVALTHALADVGVEDAGAELIVFHDADVALKTVYGMTNLAHALPKTQDPRVAVRALLATLNISPIRMLRPHLLEFDKVIKAWPRPSTSMGAGFHKAQRELLARVWELDSYRVELASILRASDKPRHDALALLSDWIMLEGYELFVRLELCFGGDWTQRLTSLLHRRAFDFSRLHPLDDFVTDDTVTEALYATLREHRQDPDLEPNNVIDAAALSGLHRLIRSPELQKKAIRFYTETVPVRQTFEMGDGQDLLAVTIGNRQVSILRTAEYFLLRASFGALGFSKARRAQPTHNGYAIDRFRTLHAELQDLMSTAQAGPELQLRVSQLRLGSTPLGELLDKLYRLQFLRDVVLQWAERPNALEELLPELLPPLSSPAFQDTATLRVMTSFRNLSSQIDMEIGAWRRWNGDFRMLRRALGQKRKVLQGGKKSARDGRALPEIDKDLGFGRWGLERELRDRERLTDLIEAALDESETRLTLRAASLAILLAQQPLERNDLEYALCACWFLQEWGLIARAWTSARETGHVDFTELPAGLHVIGFVGRVKTVYQSERETTADLTRAFDAIVRDVEAFLDGDRSSPDRHMGVAHVAYWAWKRAKEFLASMRLVERPAADSDAAAAAPQLAARGQAWARRSFAAAEEAMRHCQPNSLQFAFALNHCVYVGHAAHIHLDRVQRYYERLSDDADLHRHYRFADTLAMPFTMAVDDLVQRHTLERLVEDDSLRAERASACEALQHSHELLSNALPFFGDEEAMEHLRKVRYLKLRLGCF